MLIPLVTLEGERQTNCSSARQMSEIDPWEGNASPEVEKKIRARSKGEEGNVAFSF